MNSNITHYSENAAKLAAQYNTLRTENYLPSFALVAQQAFAKNASMHVLDLGCGSGREAMWLAEHGCNVVAVDGSEPMLAEAAKHKSHLAITYLQDMAPQLDNVQARGEKFDIALLSAFIFHLDEAERAELMETIIPLLKDDALVHVNLRHGPVPAGRTMYDVPDSEMEGFAKKFGLNHVFHGVAADELGRADVSWAYHSLWRGDTWSHTPDFLMK
ncbi:MAG: methyltransferase domain-containing protein [Alphaproteobacteria bacterium]|nr:methyltransferase domain-containing protein [Alphaproteobacteria bacterium]